MSGGKKLAPGEGLGCMKEFPMNVLPRDTPRHFLLLREVTSWSENHLEARVLSAKGSPLEIWELLEAMAQAACLHERMRAKWAKQAVVLSWPRLGFGSLDPRGDARVRVELLARVSSGASYAVRVEDAGDKGKASGELASGELTVGLVEWPGKDKTEAEDARKRSEETWRWLTKRASTSA